MGHSSFAVTGWLKPRHALLPLGGMGGSRTAALGCGWPSGACGTGGRRYSGIPFFRVEVSSLRAPFKPVWIYHSHVINTCDVAKVNISTSMHTALRSLRFPPSSIISSANFGIVALRIFQLSNIRSSLVRGLKSCLQESNGARTYLISVGAGASSSLSSWDKV